jgi:hypothetical protein
MRKNFIAVFLLTVLGALTCAFGSFAQKAIRLSHYNREIILGVDQRVKFKLTNGTVGVGRIQAIADDFFVVRDREIRFDELERLGRKGGGSNFFGIFLATLGGMISFSKFAEVVDPYDECMSCPGGQPPASDGRELLLSMSMTGAGFMILATHKTRSLEVWTLDVVNRPDR